MTRTWAIRPRGRMKAIGVAVAAAGLTAGLAATPATAGGTATATVNVVHGIPGVVVKVCVDGNSVADDFHYGDKIVGASLPAAMHHVRVVAAGKPCGTTAILKSAYTLAAGSSYTIVANVNAGGTPNLKAFVNDVSPTAVGNARLTVRHTANAPAVNVWANGSKLIAGKDFTWGKSATLAVPAGDYSVKVTLPGSRKAVIGPTSKTLAAGNAYQVYAVGTPGHYRLITVMASVGTA